MNKSQTGNDSGTKLTQPDSRLVHFEIVAWDGTKFGPFETVGKAAEFAKKRWPDQTQDEERSGRGWDIQIVGTD